MDSQGQPTSARVSTPRKGLRPLARVALPALGAAMIIGGVMIAPHRGNEAFAQSGQLTPFPSCDAVLQYFKDQAPQYLIDRAGGYGKFGGRGVPGRAAAQEDAAPTAAGADNGSGASVGHSTTNVQEVGVDEPDIVKTDGRRIIAVAQGRVHLISTQAGAMTRRSTLPDTMVRNVLLSGDRLLVFRGSEAQGRDSDFGWPEQRAVLAAYDISKLSQPRLIATLTVDGDVIDARLVGTQVRVATTSTPDIDTRSPVFGPDGQLTEKSKADLRDAVAKTTVRDWIPSYTVRDGAGSQVSTGLLADCTSLSRPETFSGLDTVAVTAFDLAAGDLAGALQPRRSAGLIAGGQQLYATDRSTYVATTDWKVDGSPATTSLHKFVTTSAGTSGYHGSGAVQGTLLNQYAMSEYDGVLRVASTYTEWRGWVNSREVTEGLVTTLKESDGVLRQLGQVGGLGRQENESIRAVRFIEDRGYVVTFRRTDPLYVIDLRDPAAPAVLGELKIPGYSGYLHPIGDHLMLGVGQSGTDNGGTGPARGGQPGVQFSLFDIRDPASPRRIDTQTYGGGYAPAEFDPKAFLYWKPRNLVIAPVMTYGDERGRKGFTGVVLLRADAKGLRQLGKIPARGADGSVSRSLVINDAVYLLSDLALQSNSLDTLRRIDRLTLG